VRPKVPTLSRSWSLISFVVAHRCADRDLDHHRAIGVKRRYDGRAVAQKRKGITQLKEPELTPAAKLRRGSPQVRQNLAKVDLAALA
jgi:hypothetical protein